MTSLELFSPPAKTHDHLQHRSQKPSSPKNIRPVSFASTVFSSVELPHIRMSPGLAYSSTTSLVDPLPATVCLLPFPAQLPASLPKRRPGFLRNARTRRRSAPTTQERQRVHLRQTSPVILLPRDPSRLTNYAAHTPYTRDSGFAPNVLPPGFADLTDRPLSPYTPALRTSWHPCPSTHTDPTHSVRKTLPHHQTSIPTQPHHHSLYTESQDCQSLPLHLRVHPHRRREGPRPVPENPEFGRKHDAHGYSPHVQAGGSDDSGGEEERGGRGNGDGAEVAE